jgi:hypothetical protein
MGFQNKAMGFTLTTDRDTDIEIPAEVEHSAFRRIMLALNPPSIAEHLTYG